MTRRTVVRLLILPLLVALLSAGSALADEPELTDESILGVSLTYQGSLRNGGSLANGPFDFEFRLYDVPAGGAQIGTTATRNDVLVQDGVFTVLLNFGTNVYNSQARWLQVAVRPGTSTGTYTILSPRTLLTAAPYAQSLIWGASMNSGVSTSTTGFSITGTVPGTNAVLKALNGGNGPAVWGVNNGGGNAIRGDGYGADSIGVYGESNTGAGVVGRSTSGFGVYAVNEGMGRNQATLRVSNLNASGGMAAYIVNGSDYHTSHFYNTNDGGVLYLQNGGDSAPLDGLHGGDFITAINEAETDVQFRVTTIGAVRSDGNYTTPAADFAEMLPAQADVEPGDLLAIGPGGILVKAVGAYSTRVAGVYSTNPGFVGGGGGAEGESQEGKVPLAMLGVVPVKVSADANGPIVAGDLLVASDIPGHAMRGEDPKPGAILGKSLGDLDSGAGIIQVLVTLQ